GRHFDLFTYEWVDLRMVDSFWSYGSNVGVSISRKRFSEKQAEQWWAENRTRVYEQYNVRMIDKSSVGIGNEDLAR
ncbi:E3 ubiquitin protein ligase HERC2, partial [Tanacetum coccineum]